MILRKCLVDAKKFSINILNLILITIALLKRLAKYIKNMSTIGKNIRKIRKPEPYKGKGVRFVGERIRRKAGKTASK